MKNILLFMACASLAFGQASTSQPLSVNKNTGAIVAPVSASVFAAINKFAIYSSARTIDVNDGTGFWLDATSMAGGSYAFKIDGATGSYFRITPTSCDLGTTGSITAFQFIGSGANLTSL